MERCVFLIPWLDSSSLISYVTVIEVVARSYDLPAASVSEDDAGIQDAAPGTHQ